MALARIVAAEKQVEKLTVTIGRLELENSILQKFVEKKTVELGPDEDDKKKKKARKNLPVTLTIEQKIDIANVINEDLQLEIEQNAKSSEKMIDTLRAVLEETEIRIGELKRDAYEFKRDVVIGAENARTGKIMAERVTRYFENKLKQVDGVIEKLRLKNSTLKSQITKVETQLAQKEEVGDVLHYIDFHQLQIENKQYVAKIEERNDELLSVKLLTGKTIQALNDYKKRLNEKLEEEAWLKSEVSSKRTLLQKLDREETRIEKEVKGEKRSRNRLRQQIEEAQAMPNIEDYIMQKKEMYELETQLANWQKKVEIMEMAARKAASTRKKRTGLSSRQASAL
jgi:chromosome segregation ATPase